TVQRVGFEDGNASVRIVFPEEADATPVSRLADLEIGLRPDVAFTSAEVYRRRFGLSCIFRPKLDTQSERKWTLNPKQSGRRIRRKLDTESDGNWTFLQPVSD